MSYPVTIYHRPNGVPEEITMTKIHDAEADWLREHNVGISMEELPNGTITIYADYGATIEDSDEPDEHVYFVAFGMTCQEAFIHIVKELKELV